MNTYEEGSMLFSEFDITANNETLHVRAGNKKAKKEKKKNNDNESESKKDESDDEIKKHLESNEVSENISTATKQQGNSIGVIVYGESSIYTNNKDADKDIHIQYAEAPSPLALWLKKIFEVLYKKKIASIVMGHEHGKENQKCHLQIVINFGTVVRRVLTPGHLKITTKDEVIKLLYMQQKAKNKFALKNYCEKDGDITIVKDETFKKKQKKGEANSEIFSYIIENKNNLTQKEAFELIQKNNPKDFFKGFNNIKNAINNIIEDKIPVEFSWLPIPEYLKNYYLANGFSFYEVFNEWYQKYCINPQKLERKKAMCLFSEKRAMGKSYFVRHLVPHPDYILEFNYNFCQHKNINSPQYKLLLLDDMRDITPETSQMWKSLIASEPTTIRGAWVNEPFTTRLPCIITTNNLNFLATIYGDQSYNTQVTIIEINEYMGEPGTKREDLFSYDFYISDNLAKKLQKINNY